MERHLQVLHDVTLTPAAENTSCLGTAQLKKVLYLDRQSRCSRVLRNMSKVRLCNGELALDTYAILDDGAEQTLLLPAAVLET